LALPRAGLYMPRLRRRRKKLKFNFYFKKQTAASRPGIKYAASRRELAHC